MASVLDRAPDEVFVAILLQLDQQDLLVSAQRVCKRWNEFIHHTASIRRYLFLDMPDTAALPSRRRRRTFSPLLTKAFPTFFQQTVDKCSATTSPQQLLSDVKLQKQTLLYERMNAPSGLQPELPSITEELKTHEAGNPFLRPDASWLRMHVSDPPARNICIQHYVNWTNRGVTVRHKVHVGARISDGLRMGDLYSSMLALAGTSKFDGLLWPMKIAETDQQCAMSVHELWPSYFASSSPSSSSEHHEAHAEPDLVISARAMYGIVLVDKVPFHSAGHVFFQQQLAETEHANFVARAINQQREREFRMRDGEPSWVMHVRKEYAKFWDHRATPCDRWPSVSRRSARYITM